MTAISPDRRMQALLIAFCFGTFFEGAAGFGTPVAISAALLIGLGFSPLYAAGLALLANTSPVAFGALGTPIITLAEGLRASTKWRLSQMAGRQLPFFSLIVPVWLVAVMSGWQGREGLLAGDPRLRRQLRRCPVLHVQLPRPDAGRRRRRPRLAGGAGRVPAILAADAKSGDFPDEARRSTADEPIDAAAPHAAAGRLRLDAVGAALGDGLPVGLAGVEGRSSTAARRSGRTCLAGISQADVRGAVAAQRRLSHRRRWSRCRRAPIAPTQPEAGRLRLQLAFGHGHGHFPGGGALGRSGCGSRRRSSAASSAARCSACAGRC